MISKAKILYFVHLPPPLHGVSTVNKFIAGSALINEGFEIKIISINYSNDLNQLDSFSVRKIFKLVSLIFKVLFNLIVFKPNYVYFSIVPLGVGFIRDSFFVVLFKVFGAKIIYHLHGNGISDVKNILIYNYRFWNMAFSRHTCF